MTPILFTEQQRGKMLPENEAAVAKIAERLRLAVMNAPNNSIITLVVKIDPKGRVSQDSSMDARQFPLREAETEIDSPQ